jgi:tetratricopeptide (TPR) repeat protein
MAHAADFAVRLSRYDDALEFAAKARNEKNELYPSAERPLGLAHFHRGEFAEAIEHLLKAEPDADGLVALVTSLIALGRLNDAEMQAARMDHVEPSAESRATIAWIKSLGARRAALSATVIAASGEALSRSTAVERAVCAEALHARGLWPERVEQLLDEAINVKAPAGIALGLRAVIRMKRGQFSRALRDAEAAISLSPNEASGYHARGHVRSEQSPAAGVKDLERAAQLSGRRDASVLHDLATAYFAMGRKTEALSAEREAAKLRPADGEIRAQLREFENGR